MTVRNGVETPLAILPRYLSSVATVYHAPVPDDLVYSGPDSIDRRTFIMRGSVDVLQNLRDAQRPLQPDHVTGIESVSIAAGRRRRAAKIAVDQPSVGAGDSDEGIDDVGHGRA